MRSEGLLHQVSRSILIFLQGKWRIPGNSKSQSSANNLKCFYSISKLSHLQMHAYQSKAVVSHFTQSKKWSCPDSCMFTSTEFPIFNFLSETFFTQCAKWEHSYQPLSALPKGVGEGCGNSPSICGHLCKLCWTDYWVWGWRGGKIGTGKRVWGYFTESHECHIKSLYHGNCHIFSICVCSHVCITYLSIHPSSTCLSLYLSSVYPPICLSIYPSSIMVGRSSLSLSHQFIYLVW